MKQVVLILALIALFAACAVAALPLSLRNSKSCLSSVVALPVNMTYYISQYCGNDSADGLSWHKAWKSLANLPGVLGSLGPGHTVAFCRGDYFTNVSFGLMPASGGTYGAPITFMSIDCYGGSQPEGLPVFTPSTQLPAGGWSTAPFNSQVLQYDLSSESFSGIAGLWVDNGRRYTPARYPPLVDPFVLYGQQGEFAFVKSVTAGNKSYTANTTLPSDLTTNYWAGTTVYYRNSNYAYYSTMVQSSSGNTITTNTYFILGFYISVENVASASNPNVVGMISSPGTMQFDPTTGFLWLYPESTAVREAILNGSTPVNVLPLGNSVALASNLEVPNIVYQGLAWSMASSGFTTNSGNFDGIITNCEFTHLISGININFNNGIFTLDSVSVVDVQGNCIVISGYNVVVFNSTLNGCGLYAGPSGDNGGTLGIYISQGGQMVNSTVSNVGYSCFQGNYGPITVSGCVCNNSMMVLNDGGAFYGFGLSSATVENNVINNVYGNLWSTTPDPFRLNSILAQGIYADQESTGWVIKGNLLRNVSTNCIFNGVTATNNAIIDNNCQSPGIYISQKSSGIVIAGNLVVSFGTPLIGGAFDGLLTVGAPAGELTSYVTSIGNNTYCQVAGIGDLIFNIPNAVTASYATYLAAGKSQSASWEDGSVFLQNCTIQDAFGDYGPPRPIPSPSPSPSASSTPSPSPSLSPSPSALPTVNLADFSSIVANVTATFDSQYPKVFLSAPLPPSKTGTPTYLRCVLSNELLLS